MPEADAGPSRRAGCPGEGPPPFAVPARNFVAALLFLVAGGAALAWRAPALAAGAFPDAGLQAATHLLTLGWISTAIMGATYQFVPAELGAPLRWERLPAVTLVVWVAGLVAFTSGLATGTPALHLTGGGLLGLGAALFGANLAATLPRAPDRDLTWWCFAGGGVALFMSWALGLVLAVSLATGLLGAGRFPVLAVHVHVAAGGWVLLTMIGVSDRMFPMALRSQGAPRLPGRAAAALVAPATALLLLSEHLLPAGVIGPALALMAVGAAAFLLQAALDFRHRDRPRLDPGLRLVAGALVLLGLAVAAGVAALAATSPSGRLLTAYGVLLVPGGLGLFVAGHAYRIVPTLTWSHRFAPVAAERDVPKPFELFDVRLALVAAVSLLAGVAAMAAGVLLGRAGVCLAGAVAFGVGAAIEAAQLVRVTRRRPSGGSPPERTG